MAWVKGTLSAPAGMSAVGRHAHLCNLDVRLVDGLRVQADDFLHVDDVALLDVLEFLQGGRKKNGRSQISELRNTSVCVCACGPEASEDHFPFLPFSTSCASVWVGKSADTR